MRLSQFTAYGPELCNTNIPIKTLYLLGWYRWKKQSLYGCFGMKTLLRFFIILANVSFHINFWTECTFWTMFISSFGSVFRLSSVKFKVLFPGWIMPTYGKRVMVELTWLTYLFGVQQCESIAITQYKRDKIICLLCLKLIYNVYASTSEMILLE